MRGVGHALVNVEMRSGLALAPVGRRVQAKTYLRGAVRHRPAADRKKFVIFARGRSGSTLLADLMGCLPEVRCDQEILSRPVLAPRRWVEAQRSLHPESHYGFKVKIYQLTEAQRIKSPQAFLQRIEADGWLLIHLQRNDFLRQVLSNSMLSRVGRSGTHCVGDQVHVPTAIRVDPAIIIEGLHLKARIEQEELAAVAGLDVVNVSYEDDLLESTAHQPTLDRLAAHLGVPTAPATTSRKRMNVGSIRELVENYDELAEALAGTPWELVRASS